MSLPDTAAEGRPVRSGIPRPIEAGLALLGLVLCSPFLAAVALSVRVTSPGPVLFRQRRVGRHGAEFTLFKFRTMRLHGPGPGITAKGDPRVTSLGRCLRLLKVDELPELWNVLRGEMSLVGPRPELPRYVDLTDPLWQVVLCARPGITDPVTLRLRNEELLIARAGEDSEKFYLERLQPYKLAGYAEYLRSRSFLSDLAVILRTVAVVLAPALAPPPSIGEESLRVGGRGSPKTAVPGQRPDDPAR
jgi:lipopolysaccharide/colanic/teichoic acid biosynthesis glycosyltransferase